MDNIYFSEILKDFIARYLKSELSRKDMISQLSTTICISDAIETDNELLRECYLDIFHMDEDYCDVSDRELNYYLDCIEGKRIFSKIERDALIGS